MKRESIYSGNYNFWESWKNLTQIERKAIKKVELARELIIKSIPKKDLVGIYVKGSFVRREMRPDSDIDIVPIVTKTSLESAVFGVNKPIIHPACVVPLSLEEFTKNKLMTPAGFHPDLRAEPDLFLKELPNYQLVYGAPLIPSRFPSRTNSQIVIDEINKIKEGYIKAYRAGKHDCPPIKEVFWLVEFYQRSRGIEVEHSFKGILDSVNDKSHIIHQAYRLKLKGELATIKDKEDYLNKLMNYLDSLEKKIKH